jgi:serine protease AprX
MNPILSYRPEGKLSSGNSRWLLCLILITVLVGLNLSLISAQEYFEETAPSKYRIEFTDKNNTPFTTDNPGEFLSPKALERRNRQNIPVDFNDLPVVPAYIDSLRSAGAGILTVSRWFNAVTVFIPHDSILDRIAAFTFVKRTGLQKVLQVPPVNSAVKPGIQQFNRSVSMDYGSSWWQTAIHNGTLLHDLGFQGKDVTIAVIDAGFYHADQLPAFSRLWDNGQILGHRDFVDETADIYEGHTHGMLVLSVIGSYLPGELIGTAPEASFYLLRSEDAGSEYLIEEDNWIAAAEFADSAGADIISSSLGYTVFDDPSQSHTYADMDGKTTRVTRAADQATSKGMLVVISAGNEGGSAWKYVGAPADADSVLATGAIDENGTVAYFSSRGPSFDGNVKPDVMAIGLGTYVIGYDGEVWQANGTSLSAPVISGLSACLWQANPGASALDMLTAVRKSADRFGQPDADYGYGIPDFNLAHVLLQVNQESQVFSEMISVFPNPFSDQLYIIFGSPVDDEVHVRLIDYAGREILNTLFPSFPGRTYLKFDSGLGHLIGGFYILEVKTGSFTGVSKLIKY